MFSRCVSLRAGFFLLFVVTSGNRAKRGYAPSEFRETRRLESEP
jgi:hypothetical protein